MKNVKLQSEGDLLWSLVFSFYQPKVNQPLTDILLSLLAKVPILPTHNLGVQKQKVLLQGSEIFSFHISDFYSVPCS